MKKYQNKDFLYQKYIQEGLSIAKIAREINCGNGTIQRWLKRLCVPTRQRKCEPRQLKLTRIYNHNHRCKDKKWLYQKYINEKLSCETIGKLEKLAMTTVGYYLRKFNIPRRKSWEVLSQNCSGENSASWKGGRVKTGQGYIYVFSPNHPFKKKTSGSKSGGYVLEHRLVMEKRLGRYLYPWEIVHHINGITDDNRDENLELLPSGKHNKEVQKVYQENIKLKQLLLIMLQFYGTGAQ